MLIPRVVRCGGGKGIGLSVFLDSYKESSKAANSDISERCNEMAYGQNFHQRDLAQSGLHDHLQAA